VMADRRFAEDGVARKVATPVPKPLTPVAIGRPVAFVSVAEVGVPRIGVTKVGDVANTAEPVPVSSVKADRRFVEDGVARKVATPVPRPLTPVEMGRPVAFVRVPLEGVPSAGVTSVGDVANTKAPEPVSSVTAVAKFAEDGVARKVATPVARPLTPVEIGRPVAFVSVALVGVPNIGLTSVGVLANTKAPLPVSSEMTPANSLDVVSASADSLSVVTTRVLDAGMVVPLRVVVLLEVSVVTVAAAGVVAPMMVLSIVPALMSAVSATRLSMLAVPSIYRSLNSNELVPRSMSLSVTGTIAPS